MAPQNPVSKLLSWFGELGIFVSRLVRTTFAPPYEFRELMRQMDEIGSKSLPLVSLAGCALGAVMSMHLRDSLIRFGGKALLPAVIILALVKESGPIVTALVVSGRAGAGIGAELGSMRVTEQIDAMEVSAVDPFRFLVATRVLACMLVLPLLTVVADFCGIMTGWAANAVIEPLSFELFIREGFGRLLYSDLLPATLKTTVFGFLIGLIGCFQGMRASGGTEGVGRAATSSVVIASLFVIFSNVVLVRGIQVWFE